MGIQFGLSGLRPPANISPFNSVGSSHQPIYSIGPKEDRRVFSDQAAAIIKSSDPRINEIDSDSTTEYKTKLDHATLLGRNSSKFPINILATERLNEKQLLSGKEAYLKRKEEKLLQEEEALVKIDAAKPANISHHILLGSRIRSEMVTNILMLVLSQLY